MGEISKELKPPTEKMGQSALHTHTHTHTEDHQIVPEQDEEN